MHRLPLSLLAVATLLSGCADTTEPQARPSTEAPPATDAPGEPGTLGADNIRVQETPDGATTGTFLPYTPGAAAVTYDPAVVPPGATAQVRIASATSGITVRLTAAGMVPRRAYGAHLHRRPCSAAPDAAGPHYQHRPDPKAAASPPSVDAEYANPRNEVWLDFTADTAGAATVTAAHPAFDRATPPRSLVLHASLTRTANGEAGTAGPRVACLTLTA
jgi:Cu-Zn family superoxide dismutase